jgi:16S rRNA (uracil1498-N3)-methyltransferase
MAGVKTRRFKVDDCTGPTLEVVGREARHALRVLRLGVGDAVALFDGRGGEVVGRIASASRTGFTVSVPEQAIPPRRDRAERPALVLAVATPKGSRADWMVEKCAEMGVGALWLLQTERGQVLPGAAKVERWRRKAVEAAKQASQQVVMTVEPPRTVAEALAASAGLEVLYGHPSPTSVSLLRTIGQRRSAAAAAEPLVIFIGPEGGFTDDECRAMKAAGGVAVSLGGVIMRIETAAMIAACFYALVEFERELTE